MPEQSPQFYTVVPEPVRYAPAPSGPSPKPSVPKSVFVALGVVVLVVTVSFLGLRLWRAREVNVALVQQQASQLAARCADGDTGCVEQAQISAASSAGLVDACDGLSAGALQRCVLRIAIDQKDPKSCELLAKGSLRDECTDAANLKKLSVEGKNVSACDVIVSSSSRTACTLNVRALAIAALDCEGYGVPQLYCDVEVKIRALLDASDYQGCSSLTGAARDTCQDRFYGEDRDQDGLSRYEEIVDHGTSDDNPDTDGDGYSDLLEINGGYNPLKKQ